MGKRKVKNIKNQSTTSHYDFKLWLALVLFSDFAAQVLGQEAGMRPEDLPEKCPAASSSTDPDKISKVQVFKDYPHILARNVTDISKFCTWKITGRNKGRICCWDDVWRFMKYEVNNARLLEIYHHILVNDNFKIRVPNAEYIVNEGELALASERILSLKTGKSISYLKPAKFRKKLVEMIGESGIAQLHAVSSIISDTIAPENWGYADGKLILVDIDGGKYLDNSRMQPSKLVDYLDLGRAIFLHDKSRIALSINNLIEMKSIYASMLTKPVPKLHPLVDMGEKLYHQLFANYADIFDITIKEIQAKNPNISLDEPLFSNNDKLAWTISDRINLINSTNIADLEKFNTTQITPSIQLNTASILVGLGKVATVIAGTIVNVAKENLTATSTALLANPAIGNFTQNATQAIATAAKTALEVVELPAALQMEQVSLISNKVMYTEFGRPENQINTTLFLQSLTYFASASIFVYLTYRSRSALPFFGCCKSRNRHKNVPLQDVATEGLKFN